MARKKSKIRSILNLRRLRWQAFRALATVFPGLARSWNFPLAAVRAVDCAVEVTENSVQRVCLPHNNAEARDILAPAAENDTGDTSATARGQGQLSFQSALVRGCTILGHTRTIVKQDTMDLVTFDGAIGNWNFAKPARLKSSPAGPHPHVLLHGAGHIFHLFSNGVLPLLRHLDGAPAEPLTLVCPSPAPGFETEVLAALGRAFPQISLRALARSEAIADADVRWVFALCSDYEWMPVTRELADRLLSILEDYWQHTGRTPERKPAARLFLDRGEAKLPRMWDDTQIRAVLAHHGYQPFISHSGNFRDQVAAFSGADEIVAVHGAGLTNLLFCRPGTRVIEIFPENFVKSTYFWLARQLGLEYHYLIGGSGDYDQCFEAGADRLDALLKALPPLPAAASAIDNRT
jgi:hypothetical protein